MWLNIVDTFFEMINKYYDRAKNLVSKIYNTGRCPDCGGTYVDSECKFCGSKNEELEELLMYIVYLIAIYIIIQNYYQNIKCYLDYMKSMAVML